MGGGYVYLSLHEFLVLYPTLVFINYNAKFTNLYLNPVH